MISKEEIKKLAELSRMAISKEEVEKLKPNFEDILEYVGKIDEVSVSEEDFKKIGVPHNVLREDKNPHKSGEYTRDLIDQTPDREGNRIKVKKILDN